MKPVARICSIAFPFRTCCPDYSNNDYNTQKYRCHYTSGIILENHFENVFKHILTRGASIEVVREATLTVYKIIRHVLLFFIG